MADWFQCRPNKFLRGLAGLSDDAQLAYTKALMLIYEQDGRITFRMLRAEFPQWRPKRLEKAVAECLEAGKLIGTATGELHNDFAMHELQQLGELSQSRASAGGKGGKVRAQRERLARKIAERNRSPDLPLDLPENEFETELKSSSNPTETDFKSNLTDIENDYEAENTNEINEGGQATLKHARAGNSKTYPYKEPPHSDPPPVDVADIELIEGEVIDDAPAPARRQPKQPMPPGWLPTRAHLSDNVQAVVAAWGDDELDEQAIKFMEWAEATDARFVHWDRAFGNWCMKHHTDRKGRRHGKAAAFNVPVTG